MRTPIYWVIVLALTITGLMQSVAMAAPDKGMNVVLLMDSSGSMARNDPKELRKPASKLLLSLLGGADQASVISFSDQGYPLTPLLSVKDPAHQKRLFGAVEKVSSRGRFTNIQKGVEAAIEVLDHQPNAGKSIIVLMSDGQMAPGSAELAKEYTDKLFGETVKQLSQRKIEVHTIAFTDESDKDLLERLSYITGGRFNVAQKDDELHKVFADIFEQNKAPDMAPIQGGKFNVDKSVSEVTVLGSKSGAKISLALQTPSGLRMTATKHPAEVKWMESELFDLITIAKPEAGQWILQSSDDSNKAYILTDLKLMLNPSATTVVVGQEISVSAWLEESGRVMDKQPVLSSLKLALFIEGTDGSWHEVPIQGESNEMQLPTGKYVARLALPGPGKYHLQAVATTPTFSREKTATIDVPRPEVVAAAHPHGAPAKPAKKPAKPPTKPAHPVAKDEALTTGMVIGLFVGFNLVLGLVIGGVMWFKRRRQHKEAVE